VIAANEALSARLFFPTAQKMAPQSKGQFAIAKLTASGDALVPTPPAPMEVMPHEEVVSRIVVVNAVMVAVVRTTPPSTAILRVRWDREAEGSRRDQHYGDSFQHDSLLFHHSGSPRKENVWARWLLL
jgi:hypothetical protein